MSAYIVALFFFGRAPIAMRVLVFVFFSATLAVLGGYLAKVGTVVASLINHQHTFTLVFGSLAIGLAGYLALFYLTFF